MLFEQKISARKFATTQVDVFHEHLDGGFTEQYERQIEKSHVSHLEKATHHA